MNRRLKMLFLCGRDPSHPFVGGGDVQAWAWARWSVQQGHDVTYVCQAHGSLARSEDMDGIHVLRLGTGIQLAVSARRHFRKSGRAFDVVYEDPIGSGRVPYLAPLWARIPVVAVWHQVSADLLRELHPPVVALALSAIERVLALFYRRCTFWVPSSERAAEIKRAFGFDPKRVHVIAPTIPPEAFAGDPTRERAQEVLFLGVIRRYKKIEHLLSAFASVVSEYPTARVVIAGRLMDAEYAEELQRLADTLGLRDHVRFEFSISPDRKTYLLARVRALVLPSILEGFGIVTLEANAVGTPAIVSSGVPAAAVDDGLNGFRYPYGDIEQLSIALRKVLDRSPGRIDMTEECVRHAQAFLPESMGIRFETLLTSALAGTIERDERREEAKGP